MAGAVAYEEQRRRTVEENRRKMDELRLRHLSAAVQAAAAPNPSPAKPVKRKRAPREAGDVEVRRSGRVASLPDKPKYRYEDVFSVVDTKIRRGNRTTSTRKDLINRVYATDEAREYAISEADELQEKLGSDYPSFVKPMTQSHVTGGFWLGLPLRFCKKYLPKANEWITLVDEEDDEIETYYLHLKAGLSAGWRKFAIDHKLVDGDCLVFELIKRNKFRVYIIRQRSYYKKA